MNPSELTFWLEWYEAFEHVLERACGAVVAYKDPDGRVRHAVDEEALPLLHELRELFLRAGGVRVFEPRPASGTQVWPAVWRDEARAVRLARLVEEPAYLAQDQGFRTEDPDAPSGLRRLIDLLEAQIHCREASREAAARCPAWARIVPELFADGADKIVAEALPSFDLLPELQVERVLAELGLPREVMSPFLPYVERPLSLERLVQREELLPEARLADDDAAGDA
ncbi:MAG: hypothetical protein R3266_11845 [Gemmatimonadota bacterium]|nr:hypothetical protein [Gemmatimonadota bacterium]